MYPYRCRDCGHRFLKFRDNTPDGKPSHEIRSTRKSLAAKRRWREFLVYASGIVLFVVFLYFITREGGGGPPDGGG